MNAEAQEVENSTNEMGADTKVNNDALKNAYEKVRDDRSGVKWSVFKYNKNELGVCTLGTTFQDFKKQFLDHERAFGYIRIEMSDAIGRRGKFILVTWIGKRVCTMLKGKTSRDKSLVKDIIKNFSLEFTLENGLDLDEDLFKMALKKATS